MSNTTVAHPLFHIKIPVNKNQGHNSSSYQIHGSMEAKEEL